MNVYRGIELYTGIYIFMLGIVLLAASINSTTKYVNVVSNQILDDNVVFESEEYTTEMIIYSKDIISLLHKKLEYDVKINNLVINKDSFNYLTFDFSQISETYSKSYELDESGSIKYVVFLSITSTQIPG